MSSLNSCFGLVHAIAIITVALAGRLEAAEPLYVRIDRLIAVGQIGPASGIANDAEFLRRVYLDLTGEIPSATAARLFLDDASPDKRSKLVDRLLSSSNYARHMANVFSVILMERRVDKAIPSSEWRQYLRQSCGANKPYNQLAREILGADGVGPALRPAAKFYLDRDGEPNLLTRDVGRIFFGRDFQCAQCHDHPLIESYYQADYYGLFACFNRGMLFTDPKDKKVYFAEKGDGGVAFNSVFDPAAKGVTRPRLPGGAQLDEPEFAPGDEYTVKPANGVRPVPKYSRRARLAAEATSGENRAFNENIANRLWAHLLGRGLIEPVDLHHVDNPPSHPELLALLTDELVAMKFDIKAFLREIVLSETYQRSIDLPELQLAATIENLAAQVPFLESELQRLTTAAAESSKAVERLQEELRGSRAAAVDLAGEVDKRTAAMGEAKQAAEKAQQALAQAQSALSAKQDVANAVSEAATHSERAAQKLVDDQPLAQAAAKFNERAVQLAAEVAAAAKIVAEHTASANAAAEKLARAQNSVAEAIEKRNAANTCVESVEKDNTAAVAKTQADRAAAKQIERRLYTLKSLWAYQAARKTRDASQATVAMLDADLESSKQKSAKLAAELPAKKEALEAAQEQHAATVKAFSETQQQLAVKNESSQIVALAAAKTEIARQKLPADSELAKAAQTVKARGDELAGEAAELKSMVDAHKQSANQMAGAVAAAKQALDSATAELGQCNRRIATVEMQRQAAVSKLSADQQQLSRAAEELIQYESKQFATASLKPLSPEQLAWSVMQAVGLAHQLRGGSEAELNAKTPLTDAIRNDPAQMAARAQQIDDATYAKVEANAARFVELFSTGAGQPQTFFATADQALFFANDGQVRGWLAPSGGNLTDRLGKLSDLRAFAEELYLSVLSRQPTEAEIAETAAYLASRSNERPAAIQELVWALITSLEFRFNH